MNGRFKSIPNSLAIEFIAFFALIASTAEELTGMNFNSPPPSNKLMISAGILLIQLASVMTSELFIEIDGASIISVTFQNFARP